MSEAIENGTVKEIEGKASVFYEGYWVRHYTIHSNRMVDKKHMIDQLTRRVFHNMEAGINTPGYRVEEVREIYESESCPAKKRVKGAMLAGALLNRGRDILQSIVELEAAGVTVESNNELFEKCGQCFLEALKLGEQVKLANGGEGVSELWGEPFRVFSLPIDDFFVSRYIKIAQSMAEMDKVRDNLMPVLNQASMFSSVKEPLLELCQASKLTCETLRSDPIIYEIWPRYVVARENYDSFKLDLSDIKTIEDRIWFREGHDLIREGGELLCTLSSLRVPIPRSVASFIGKCERFVKYDKRPDANKLNSVM